MKIIKKLAEELGYEMRQKFHPIFNGIGIGKLEEEYIFILYFNNNTIMKYSHKVPDSYKGYKTKIIFQVEVN